MKQIWNYLYQSDWEGGRLAASGVKSPVENLPFRGIVNLSNYKEYYPVQPDLSVLHVKIQDHRAGIGPHILPIVSFVWDFISIRQPVLIHCAAGISRSSAASAACLISRGFSLEEAQQRIKERWPRSEINPCFLPELEAWERKLNAVRP